MTNIQVQGLPASQRVNRYPTYSAHLFSRPFAIQPFMCAPVLPGETMTNLLHQARVVTQPLKNPIIGWWCETAFFYVKHSDLAGREDFAEMMLDVDKDLSAYNSTDEYRYYHKSGINWMKLALQRVVEEYYRDEGETWNVPLFDNLPKAKVQQKSWMDSVTNDADVSTYDVDLTDVGGPGGANVLASEIEDTMRTWQFMRMNGMTEMTYEDYLATFGIKGAAAVETHVPELIRYNRDWTYPTNTINPADGAPSTAAVWTVTERADKDRRFMEPGFILGLVVVKPKVYFSQQTQGAISMMNDAYSWLPAVLRDDPASSLKKMAALSQPLASNTDAYWVDLRDLLLYGDQHLNLNLATTLFDFNQVALPTAGLDKHYVPDADINDLFVDITSAGNYYNADSVTKLTIKGTQIDQTPSQINRIPGG